MVGRTMMAVLTVVMMVMMVGAIKSLLCFDLFQ